MSNSSKASTMSSLPNDERNLAPETFSQLSLTGKDALGRSINPVDHLKAGNHYVGLFYFLWLGQHPDRETGDYDITALLSTTAGTQALQSEDDPRSPKGQYHFCSQPLYGYYNMGDPWILNRHVELLTMAGIDYLCFDATNTFIYPEVTYKLLDTLLKYQQAGWNVPKIMFYTNSDSGTTVEKIYSSYYNGQAFAKYSSLYWAPNGKPQIVGITAANKGASDQGSGASLVSDKLQQFFDVKESQWPTYAQKYNANGFPWMSWTYPQEIHNGIISAPVAQHSHEHIVMSWQAPESSRGYNNLTQKKETDYAQGKNFQQMWDTALNDTTGTIENVMATGWNEWMAIKSYDPTYGGANFCDTYNEEYSRDIEMMKGSLADDFYLQFLENARAFKYEKGVRYHKSNRTIDIASEAAQTSWQFVQPIYRDFSGDAMKRHYLDASGKNYYDDDSARNDITQIQFTQDDTNLYCRIECLATLTAYNGTDTNYMNLFLGTGSSPSFEGFNYLINRSLNLAEGTSTIEKSQGGYSWEKVGTAHFKIYDNAMVLAIPLAPLGLSQDDPEFSFKVADGVTHPDDIMDYYVSGDSAPIGRLAYAY